MRLIIIFYVLCLTTLADTVSLTPAEKEEIEAKIVAIDAKIVLCETKPIEIAKEQAAIYDKYIKVVNPSFAAWLSELKKRMLEKPEVKAAEVKASLVAEKATLAKEIAEPNSIEETKPK